MIDNGSFVPVAGPRNVSKVGIIDKIELQLLHRRWNLEGRSTG